MQYDSVKIALGKVFNRSTLLRKLFYALLDLLLLRAWHIKKELRRLAKNMPQDAWALDAGAGFGQYTYYMSTLGRNWKIKAIDLKPEQVEDCNRFFEKIARSSRVRFEVADLTLFCEPQKYEMAIAIDVLEHIPNDEAVFRNICNSLKPGGVLLISTPSDAEENKQDAFIDEHARDGYNANEIRDKLTQAGFSEIDVKYTYGRPGRIAWLISMKTPMRMLGISKLFFILLPAYYLLTFPLCILLNIRDVCEKHKTGTGLKITAQRSYT